MTAAKWCGILEISYGKCATKKHFPSPRPTNVSLFARRRVRGRRMQVLLLGGHKDRESLLPGLSDQAKSTLCILPSDIDGNMHQIAFQVRSAEDIRQGLYAVATRTPSRTYGCRTRLHDSVEQQIWIDRRDIATMYVEHTWPVDFWEHKSKPSEIRWGKPTDGRAQIWDWGPMPSDPWMQYCKTRWSMSGTITCVGTEMTCAEPSRGQ